MIEDRSLYSLNYVLNQLGKRILPQYFYEKNPEEMIKWQNQICRQSHVIACYFLDKWLNSDVLEYNIEFFEGIFQDKVTGDLYDHSWVFIQSISSDKDCYICDIARISEHIGFKRCENGQNTPDRFISDSEDITERRSYDWNLLMKDPEHYTHLPGTQIVMEIEDRLRKNRLWIS